MKKLALSLVALMFATSVFAMNFSVGAKGNIGIATTIQSYDGEPAEDILPVFSGSIGGVFGIQFTEMFALEPEVMFHFGNGYSGEGEDLLGRPSSLKTATTQHAPPRKK